MQPRLLTAGAIAAALLVLPLTGCGDDSEGGGGGAPPDADLVVHALDTLKFDKTEYDTAAGEISVAYINDGSILHTLVVEDLDGLKLEVNNRGEVDEGTVTLEEGTYTLFCDVPAHRAGGMEATLTVTEAAATAS